MKNKKIVNFIIILMCAENFALCNPRQNKIDFSTKNQSLTHTKQLSFEKNISLCKMIFLPSILCTLCYLNSKQFIKNIQENPLLFLVGSCVVFNFIMDTSIKYQQINETICLFHLSKVISRYMLYAIAIKNAMIQVAKKDTCCRFTEEEFFNIITKDIPLSFKELEQLTFNILHNCVKDIQNLHIKIHTDTEEQIYLLCKEHITLNDVISLYSADTKLNALLQKLQENPTEYYKDAALELNTLIKKQFQYMIKYQPEIS